MTHSKRAKTTDNLQYSSRGIFTFAKHSIMILTYNMTALKICITEKRQKPMSYHISPCFINVSITPLN